MNESFNTRLFQIGKFCFQLRYSSEVYIPPNFLNFESNSGEPEYTYTISCSDELPKLEQAIIAVREDIVILGGGSKEGRLIGVKGSKDYYACYQELSDNQAAIVVRRKQLAFLQYDTVFSSLMALEKRMLQKDSLILHCAYIRYAEKGILFSGISGIGKSTQADLWKIYKNARVINGDRALLCPMNHQWFACGWPVCGSSDICNNESAPVQAIVMLSQGKENYVERISSLQAFTQLYSQITINMWNRESQEHAISLLEVLIDAVPVYHFRCNISEEAVLLLEQVLFSDHH